MVYEESFEFIKNIIATDNEKEIEYYLTSGNELRGVESESVDFIFSRDSLVRMPYEDYRLYACEFDRVLKKGGKFFIHLAHGETTSSNDPPYSFSKKEIIEMHDWATITVSGEKGVPFPLHWGSFIFGEKNEN
jgi:ubiquinone/menaquinone biosynthesis C-methylase UbiE